MTINLYIGDTNIELAEQAISVDPRAFLIDHSNYKEFLNKSPNNSAITAYTSLGDLPKLSSNNNAIYSVLSLADNIYYCPPAVWSDNKSIDFTNITNSLHGLTEFILYHFAQQKNNVYGLDLTKYSTQLYTELVDSRKTDGRQLWVAGCSMSHAIGVDKNQRYGQLLAESLGLPVSFLTNPGSSISWAVDQLVRSDIQAGDIVILGLTDETRFPYWLTKNKVWHVTTNHHNHIDQLPFTNLSTSIVDRLITDNNCMYQSVVRIHQLVNFCSKIDAKLLIVGLLASEELQLLLHNQPTFINYKNFELPFSFIDLGTDDMHPGPLQHQLYTDFCQSALKKLNYI
jgi:hypothetical protein